MEMKYVAFLMHLKYMKSINDLISVFSRLFNLEGFESGLLSVEGYSHRQRSQPKARGPRRRKGRTFRRHLRSNQHFIGWLLDARIRQLHKDSLCTTPIG